ncbi:hypothetical protein CH339_08710 [Rhodobium orientis]|uniref:Photosynthetic complex assembly protein n=2 Tax=Rhodobium orientis TaxID=34017 RepID=A0A327JXM9_9HYPH|nr:hypothetical protein [Rhodobium orientis]RAI27848.1 hypothetical protein CH339_08710 [Rhodobium orientis]
MNVAVASEKPKKERKGRVPSFPRFPLYSALALVGFALIATIFGSVTDIGTVRNGLGQPVAIRDVVITRDAADSVTVTDAMSGDEIAVIGSGEGGFVRGALRGLDRMRLVAEVGKDQPYRIIKWENGWVSLSDTGTGQRLYLNAFGPDNAAAFEAFLKNYGDVK